MYQNLVLLNVPRSRDCVTLKPTISSTTSAADEASVIFTLSLCHRRHHSRRTNKNNNPEFVRIRSEHPRGGSAPPADRVYRTSAGRTFLFRLLSCFVALLPSLPPPARRPARPSTPDRRAEPPHSISLRPSVRPSARRRGMAPLLSRTARGAAGVGEVLGPRARCLQGGSKRVRRRSRQRGAEVPSEREREREARSEVSSERH